jgi:hypothetical protein
MVIEKRTSYPIPDGYRMLRQGERIEEGDKAWAAALSKFVTVHKAYAGQDCKTFVCPIREDADYLLANIEGRQNGGKKAS